MKVVHRQTIIAILLGATCLVGFLGITRMVDADVDGGPTANVFNIPKIGNIDSLNALLDKIVDFLIAVGAPIATIMVIYAGLSYIFAAGDTQKLAQARAILIWTAVGFGIILVAKGIIKVIEEFFGTTST